MSKVGRRKTKTKSRIKRGSHSWTVNKVYFTSMIKVSANVIDYGKVISVIFIISAAFVSMHVVMKIQKIFRPS